MLNKSNFWKNKKVIVIGSGGFKGKWLVALLKILKAKVVGINKTTLKNKNFNNYKANLLDEKKIALIFKKEKPKVVFHLAAQPIVSESYKNPLDTYKTNILGLLNVLELIRKYTFIKSTIIVTSDKCYRINEKSSDKPLVEESALGGNDPYSASKACAEIISSSYYKSFFSNQGIKRGLATVRAGNVVGGGDWSKDRIVPDIINSIIKKNKLKIRNPYSKRPWQYILDVLYGYIILAEKLYKNPIKFSSGWNFAKDYKKKSLNVNDVVKLIFEEFDMEIEFKKNKRNFHEEKKYIISGNKSKKLLGWDPLYDHAQSLKKTAKWYKEFFKRKPQEHLIIDKYCQQYLKDLKI